MPCSGKSTYATKLSIDKNATILSSDEIREELYNGTYNKDDNTKVFNEVYNRIYSNIIKNKSVILDATNTSKLYRAPYINLAKEYSYRVCAIIVNTPLDLCLERNKARAKEKKITKTKMLQIHKYFEKPENVE